MAFFTKSTKTRISRIKGNIEFQKFITPVSRGEEKALIISLKGEDLRNYSITLYADEIQQLQKYLLTK